MKIISLNNSLVKIRFEFEKLYKELTNISSKSIKDFNDSERQSIDLSNNRRGENLSFLELHNIDIYSFIKHSLSKWSIDRVDKLFNDFGKEEYYFAIYGIPSSTSKWAFSLDGSLLSINFTFEGDEKFSSVPMLMGTKKDTNKELRKNVMSTEIGIACDLFSLIRRDFKDDNIKLKLKTDKITYSYSEKLSIIPAGIPVNKLADLPDVNFFFGMLLSVYIHKVPKDIGSLIYSQYLTLKTDEYRFAWSGDENIEGKFYYSITSKDFVIEFLKNEKNESDIITTMRHRDFDFGKQL